jgi:hypothetical protein
LNLGRRARADKLGSFESVYVDNMQKSITVFVCSTFIDLSPEREAVLDAIRRLELKHDSMEFFGARAEQPIETCLEEVRNSDMLIVLVGHRYGSIVPGLHISYSEAEYNEGYQLGKPCLVYMRDENVPILLKNTERDPQKIVLLDKWKATLQERHTIATFQDGNRLAVQVAADLARIIQDIEETAKTRAINTAKESPDFLLTIDKIVTDALHKGATESSILSAIRGSLSSLLVNILHEAPTVFLSYSREDSKIVDSIAKKLKNAGIRLWFDKVDLKPGDNWMQEIENSLSSARFVIFFISQNSIKKSVWAKQELQIALYRQITGEGGARIIPVILEDADVPPLLRQFQWIDLRDSKNFDIGVRKLIEAIKYWTDRTTGSE